MSGYVVVMGGEGVRDDTLTNPTIVVVMCDMAENESFVQRKPVFETKRSVSRWKCSSGDRVNKQKTCGAHKTGRENQSCDDVVYNKTLEF
jgi:hypothetical protein